MGWGDLSWLSERGYEKRKDADERGPQEWVRPATECYPRVGYLHEIVVRFTGDDHLKEECEVSSMMIDDGSCVVAAAIDNIPFDSLRRDLALYERRVLAMLHVGLIFASDPPPRPARQDG